jgi:GT2 family glycosyltransferase
MKYSSIYDDITVLTVTHNSSNVIEDFLNTLDTNFKLVIVDNNSVDNTKTILKKHNRKSINLFFNDKGLGFGSGANIGLKTIKSKFVLLVNPDSIIKTGAPVFNASIWSGVITMLLKCLFLIVMITP